ncbi:plastocyanin [Candidatus Nitrososphaera evergladensis SR1]|uniref:Plastocyanin n=1 Tax=Candidatus Nitrososphaera evergladensis SR1 TaxID=1459636 RepID=A0A075MY27_9ARCH|nr:plastocyanin/azurin family copper-binding protein [Candidatus Nitrososphaera evergladensis]AIF85562.1 plastocyanin [Candidatus Nitrososphaera evergladensis SR1]
MVLAFAVLGALLYVSAIQTSGRIAHDSKAIPTEPKISQLQAIETAEKHLQSKVKGVQEIRLEFPLYNFSMQRYTSDPSYVEYIEKNNLRHGSLLSQVKEHPELLNLPLYFVHANGTLYSVNATGHTFEKVCEEPSFRCPLPVLAINASRDKLVYRVYITWPKPSIPTNEALYLVNAETGEITMNFVDAVLNRLPTPNVNFDNRTISQLYNELANPPQTTNIDIEQGASDQGANKGYSPKEIRVVLGTNNRVVWTNRDTVPESVVSDSGYIDELTGKKFESGLILPGGTFEFTFTKEGEYSYHAEPHPWMTGKISVVEGFA